jgi:uncharacterized protein YggL (DUF469 family)
MRDACPLLGFQVTVELPADLPAAAVAALRASFQRDVVQRHGLVCTGGGDHTWRYWVTREGDQATDADRAPVTAWISAHATESGLRGSAGPIENLRESD